MEKLLVCVYRNKPLTAALHFMSYIIAATGVGVFAAMLTFAYLRAPIEALKLVLCSGVPFCAVTVFRAVVNAQRPYERYSFYEQMPKSKRGKSFPSRHVFSIFIIAVLSYQIHIALSAVLLLLGAALAAARVLLGIHYISDVAVGAAVGIVFGIVGLLIIL